MSFKISVSSSSSENPIMTTGDFTINDMPFMVNPYLEDEDVFKEVIQILGRSVSSNSPVRVGFIVNTVRRAQEVFEFLSEWLEDEELFNKVDTLLIHSRFTVHDRLEKESEIFSLIGKGVLASRSSLVIATQVVEQSLDIDFDILWSDVAPVENLIQRAGRVHRHRRDRPLGFEVPVFNIVSSEASVDYASLIYGAFPVKVAIEWAGSCGSFGFSDISNIVDSAYALDAIQRYPEEYSNWITKSKDRESKAQLYRIKSPFEASEVASYETKAGLYGWLLSNEKDVSDLTAEAKVRDGDSGPSVVLLFETSQGLVTSSGYRVTEAQASFISYKEQKEILKSSVIFPRLTEAKIADIISSAEDTLNHLLGMWSQTSLLAGEIPFVIKQNGFSSDNEYFYSYLRGLENNGV